ncbi:unnamed protein product [Trichobilharzia szidati]|nr:unnamed protein product [Trichobilharzia szidati]
MIRRPPRSTLAPRQQVSHHQLLPSPCRPITPASQLPLISQPLRHKYSTPQSHHQHSDYPSRRQLQPPPGPPPPTLAPRQQVSHHQLLPSPCRPITPASQLPLISQPLRHKYSTPQSHHQHSDYPSRRQLQPPPGPPPPTLAPRQQVSHHQLLPSPCRPITPASQLPLISQPLRHKYSTPQSHHQHSDYPSRRQLQPPPGPPPPTLAPRQQVSHHQLLPSPCRPITPASQLPLISQPLRHKYSTPQSHHQHSDYPSRRQLQPPPGPPPPTLAPRQQVSHHQLLPSPCRPITPASQLPLISQPLRHKYSTPQSHHQHSDYPSRRQLQPPPGPPPPTLAPRQQVSHHQLLPSPCRPITPASQLPLISQPLRHKYSTPQSHHQHSDYPSRRQLQPPPGPPPPTLAPRQQVSHHQLLPSPCRPITPASQLPLISQPLRHKYSTPQSHHQHSDYPSRRQLQPPPGPPPPTLAPRQQVSHHQLLPSPCRPITPASQLPLISQPLRHKYSTPQSHHQHSDYPSRRQLQPPPGPPPPTLAPRQQVSHHQLLPSPCRPITPASQLPLISQPLRHKYSTPQSHHQHSDYPSRRQLQPPPGPPPPTLAPRQQVSHHQLLPSPCRPITPASQLPLISQPLRHKYSTPQSHHQHSDYPSRRQLQPPPGPPPPTLAPRQQVSHHQLLPSPCRPITPASQLPLISQPLRHKYSTPQSHHQHSDYPSRRQLQPPPGPPPPTLAPRQQVSHHQLLPSPCRPITPASQLPLISQPLRHKYSTPQSHHQHSDYPSRRQLQPPPGPPPPTLAPRQQVSHHQLLPSPCRPITPASQLPLISQPLRHKYSTPQSHHQHSDYPSRRQLQPPPGPPPPTLAPRQQVSHHQLLPSPCRPITPASQLPLISQPLRHKYSTPQSHHQHSDYPSRRQLQPPPGPPPPTLAPRQQVSHHQLLPSPCRPITPASQLPLISQPLRHKYSTPQSHHQHSDYPSRRQLQPPPGPPPPTLAPHQQVSHHQLLPSPCRPITPASQLPLISQPLRHKYSTPQSHHQHSDYPSRRQLQPPPGPPPPTLAPRQQVSHHQLLPSPCRPITPASQLPLISQPLRHKYSTPQSHHQHSDYPSRRQLQPPPGPPPPTLAPRQQVSHHQLLPSPCRPITPASQLPLISQPLRHKYSTPQSHHQHSDYPSRRQLQPPPGPPPPTLAPRQQVSHHQLLPSPCRPITPASQLPLISQPLRHKYSTPQSHHQHSDYPSRRQLQPPPGPPPPTLAPRQQVSHHQLLPSPCRPITPASQLPLISQPLRHKYSTPQSHHQHSDYPSRRQLQPPPGPPPPTLAPRQQVSHHQLLPSPCRPITPASQLPLISQPLRHKYSTPQSHHQHSDYPSRRQLQPPPGPPPPTLAPRQQVSHHQLLPSPCRPITPASQLPLISQPLRHKYSTPQSHHQHSDYPSRRQLQPPPGPPPPTLAPRQQVSHHQLLPSPCRPITPASQLPLISQPLRHKYSTPQSHHQHSDYPSRRQLQPPPGPPPPTLAPRQQVSHHQLLPSPCRPITPASQLPLISQPLRHKYSTPQSHHQHSDYPSRRQLQPPPGPPPPTLAPRQQVSHHQLLPSPCRPITPASQLPLISQPLRHKYSTPQSHHQHSDYPSRRQLQPPPGPPPPTLAPRQQVSHHQLLPSPCRPITPASQLPLISQPLRHKYSTPQSHHQHSDYPSRRQLQPPPGPPPPTLAPRQQVSHHQLLPSPCRPITPASQLPLISQPLRHKYSTPQSHHQHSDYPSRRQLQPPPGPPPPTLAPRQQVSHHQLLPSPCRPITPASQLPLISQPLRHKYSTPQSHHQHSDYPSRRQLQPPPGPPPPTLAPRQQILDIFNLWNPVASKGARCYNVVFVPVDFVILEKRQLNVTGTERQNATQGVQGNADIDLMPTNETNLNETQLVEILSSVQNQSNVTSDTYFFNIQAIRTYPEPTVMMVSSASLAQTTRELQEVTESLLNFTSTTTTDGYFTSQVYTSGKLLYLCYCAHSINTCLNEVSIKLKDI